MFDSLILSVLLDTWKKGIWSWSQVMVMHVWMWLTAPTQPSQALTCRVGARGARHTLIPQHPDLGKPVAACSPKNLATRFFSNLSAYHATLPAWLSQCHGWAQDLSSLALLILPLWANAAPQTRNKSSQCKLKTIFSACWGTSLMLAWMMSGRNERSGSKRMLFCSVTAAGEIIKPQIDILKVLCVFVFE